MQPILEDFGGRAHPLVSAKLLDIFLKFFLFCSGFANSSEVLLAIPGSYQRIVTSFEDKILAPNQTKFQFLLAHFCHFIVTKEHTLMVLHSLVTYHLEIMPLINKYYNVLESIVTFRSSNE